MDNASSQWSLLEALQAKLGVVDGFLNIAQDALSENLGLSKFIDSLKNERQNLQARIEELTQELETMHQHVSMFDHVGQTPREKNPWGDDRDASFEHTAELLKLGKALLSKTEQIKALKQKVKDLEEDNERLGNDLARTEIDWEAYAKRLKEENDALKSQLAAAEHQIKVSGNPSDEWVEIDGNNVDDVGATQGNPVTDATVRADLNKAKASRILSGVTRRIWGR